MVYIRGTAAQTQVAIRYISEYFGGRPALSADEMIVSTSDYTAVTVPTAALSYIFNNEYNGSFFPPETGAKVAGMPCADYHTNEVLLLLLTIGVPVFFEPIVGEPAMRLIFEGHEGRFASEIVMDTLRVWQSIGQPSEPEKLKPVARTGMLLTRPITSDVVDDDSMIEGRQVMRQPSAFSSSSSSADAAEQASLTEFNFPEDAKSFDERDLLTEIDDGICGFVFVLTASSINWFMNSLDEHGHNFVSSLMASLKCFIGILPASCSRISKCVEVRKISLVAPSKRIRKLAVDKIVRHILSYRGLIT